MKRYVPRVFGVVLPVLAAFLAVAGVHRYQTFRPAAITLGPETTLYFDDDPTLSTRVHEAIHRRQMREKSVVGRLWSALRYNFDYGYRLDEEAEAKAGELCLQIHRFSSELPSHTTDRSRRQAEAYRAWAWERVGLEVPDRVGRYLDGGARCSEILSGVVLDLPPEARLSESDRLKMATLRFLQAYGSSQDEVDQWRARLELAGYAEPAPWEFVGRRLPFHLIPLARAVAAVEPDTTITAREAGEALHRLTYYRAERIHVRLRQPRAPYRRELVAREEAERGVGVPMEAWSTELLERALDGDLTPGRLAWLERMAAHPVHRDFERFARAPAADVIGTRYQRSPEAESEWIDLPLTDLDPIEEVFRAQWGRVVLAAARDDLDEATSLVRLLVAGTLQFVESAPFEADVVLGLELMEEALRGMVRLRLAGGEDGEDEGTGVGVEVEGGTTDAPGAGGAPTWVRAVLGADTVPGADAGGEVGEGDARSAEGWVPPPHFWDVRHRRALLSDDPVMIHQALPAIAADDLIPYAFRRFAYRQVVLYDVCLELSARTESERRVRREWRARVDVGLIRRPSDRWFIGLLRSRVEDILARSAVPLDEVCDAAVIRRPGVRIAILIAPPAGRMRADD